MRSLSRIIKHSKVNVGEKYELMSQIVYPTTPKRNPTQIQEEINIENTKTQLISQVMQEAASLMNEAKKQREILLQNAVKQNEELYEEAKQKGYEEGYHNGFQQGQTEGYTSGKLEAQNIICEAEAIRQQALEEKKQILEEAQPEMVELGFLIAQKILRETIKVNPTYILELLKTGISAVSATRDIKILVSEEDFQIVLQNKDILLKISDEIQHIEVSKNLSLTAGQCMIETAFGSIDCSLDTQIEGIKKELNRLVQGE